MPASSPWGCWRLGSANWLPREKKDEQRKGTVIGVVTARGPNFIEVKGDGEEKARRYTPHIVKEGATEKATLEMLAKIPVGTRIKLDWLFAERPRVIKIEVLKKE